MRWCKRSAEMAALARRTLLKELCCELQEDKECFNNYTIIFLFYKYLREYGQNIANGEENCQKTQGPKGRVDPVCLEMLQELKMRLL